jgi:hypothetical protein
VENMKKEKEPVTYDGEVLRGLAFEFSFSDHTESERKIKRRLREKKLGAYDQTRIDAIRGFKDDIQKELGKFDKSEFYLGPTGKYADMSDWDYDRLLIHMQKKHQNVEKSAISGFLSYAIYLYYMR